MKLLLATNNAHKRTELAAALAPRGIEVVTPADLGGVPDVDEDQPTFAGNAAKKAVSAASARGMWALADDSGLEVDALDGAPGVHSARYAGVHGDDAANNAKLLAALADTPDGARGARFVAALSLADPQGHVVLEIQGTARGRILHAPRGGSGFGYDPLFLFVEEGFPQTGRGFAELSLDEKAEVSHRGRALRRLLEQLPQALSRSSSPH